MHSDSDFQQQYAQYKKEIKSKIVYEKSDLAKAFFKNLQLGFDEYLADNDGVTIDEIYEHFGTPEEIAAEFLNNTDAKAVKKKIRIKKIIIAVAVIIILIIGIGVAKIAHDANEDNATYGDYTPLNSENESSDVTSEDFV